MKGRLGRNKPGVSWLMGGRYGCGGLIGSAACDSGEASCPGDHSDFGDAILSGDQAGDLGACLAADSPRAWNRTNGQHVAESKGDIQRFASLFTHG